MDKLKFYKSIFWISLVLLGCAKEDPNLVNPPMLWETITIKFFNGARSTGNLALDLEEQQQSQQIAYLELSDTIKPPPLDSITIGFRKDGKLIYKSDRRVRFARYTRYLVVAGESYKSNGIADTFLVLYNTVGLPKNQQKSYFKFLNLVKDSNLRFTLTLGCPNGKPLVRSIPYFQFPFLVTIESGNNSLSLISETNGMQTFLNLYEINFEEDKEYTIIVAKDKFGEIKLFLIDDYDNTKNALSEIIPQTDRVAYLRTINFTTSGLSITKLPSYSIAQQVEPLMIDNFRPFPVCDSEVYDSILVSNGKSETQLNYSFEVNRKYTLLVFERSEGIKTILLDPFMVRTISPNQCAIRVVNALDDSVAITLSLGARSEYRPNGFISGEVLASKLFSNNVSGTVLISSGYFPLTLFSSTEPSYLLGSFVSYVSAGKFYTIVVFRNQNGNIVISLVEENDEQHQLDETPTGYFIQFLNTNPELTNASLAIEGIFSSAILKYKESLSTVIPFTQNKITINGKDFNLEIIPDTRGLFLISGGQVLELLNFSIPPMGNNRNNYRRRFINASTFCPNITICSEKDLNKAIVSNLQYASSSPVESISIERKFSIFFFDSNSQELLAQFNDVYLTFGKNYSLVFTSSSNKNHSLIVVQEY